MLIAGLLIGGAVVFLMVRTSPAPPPRSTTPQDTRDHYLYVSPQHAKALASGDAAWVPIFTKVELEDGSQGSILRLEPSDVESEPVVAFQPKETPA